jgi:hypothetical protein
MSAIIIARFESKREANAAAKFMKRYRSEVRIMNPRLWDDWEFGKLIDEGMREKGEVSIETIREKLRR